MIENLYIKNYILIDELNIDFKDSFSAFIGETGAGKSIFIDAIGMLTGNKMTSAVIRKGAEKAILEGSFTLNEKMCKLLEEAGYDSEQLIVSREINTDGKSTVRVNNRLTTVGFIRELFSPFIDIHSQNDNQYLLNEKYHRQLLDEYADDQILLNETANLYHEFHSIELKEKELENTTYNQSQLEIIKYQLDEIEKLNITDLNEDEKIEDRLKLAKESEKIQQSVEEIRTLFSDDGILDKLYQFNRLAHNLEGFSAIQENIKKINDDYYDLNDNYETIMDAVKEIEIDEREIDELNQRLYDLQRAKRKYDTDLKGLQQYHQQLTEQIQEYDNKDFVLANLKKEKEKAYQNYLHKATELSDLRKEKAQHLEKQIMDQLNDLSLPKARFSVDFKTSQPSANGIDEICFLVAMNAGQPLMPLAKVASGGEISRLMLGLKVIFAHLQGTRLIIFDEIDSGVSGYVALNIGVKMHQLARDMQVFAITHLPSVASCSDHHYLIEKFQKEDVTETTVRKLNEENFIEQLAILSSSNISQTSLKAARELYENAKERCR